MQDNPPSVPYFKEPYFKDVCIMVDPENAVKECKL
jgi:hypothetical protein